MLTVFDSICGHWKIVPTPARFLDGFKIEGMVSLSDKKLAIAAFQGLGEKLYLSFVDVEEGKWKVNTLKWTVPTVDGEEGSPAVSAPFGNLASVKGGVYFTFGSKLFLAKNGMVQLVKNFTGLSPKARTMVAAVDLPTLGGVLVHWDTSSCSVSVLDSNHEVVAALEVASKYFVKSVFQTCTGDLMIHSASATHSNLFSLWDVSNLSKPCKQTKYMFGGVSVTCHYDLQCDTYFAVEERRLVCHSAGLSYFMSLKHRLEEL